MRALTVRHPFALAIVMELKPVENRDGPSVAGQARKLIGQRVAIHASKQIEKPSARNIVTWANATADKLLAECLRTAGHILALATIDRVIEHGDGDPLNDSPWRTRDRFGIVLRDMVWLAAPVPAKGALGFWTLSPDVEAAVLVQERAARGTR